MNFKLLNSTSDKTFGRFDLSEVKDIYLFNNTYTDGITLKVVLNNGSEVIVDSNGRNLIAEFADGKIVDHNINKDLIVELAS